MLSLSMTAPAHSLKIAARAAAASGPGGRPADAAIAAPLPPGAAGAHLAALHGLLDVHLALACEYGPGLTSHLPMALAALHGIGADEPRLRAFFACYARRLAARPASSAASTLIVAPDENGGLDWTILRGRFEAFDLLRARFAQALADEGRDAVLRDVLPWLVTGVAGVAFHGLIRTAHAVEAGHAGELAAALAYWAARWMPLARPIDGGMPFESVADWLDALDARLLEADRGWRPEGELIARRMAEATWTTAYRELAGRSGVEGDPAGWLRVLGRAAAARYASTRNFTVLHMTTAARAARVLSPWLPVDGVAWGPVAQAVAAASLASRVATSPRRPVELHGFDWAQVRALALASDDDHAIKLVHAAVAQNAREPHPVWLAAANAAVAG